MRCGIFQLGFLKTLQALNHLAILARLLNGAVWVYLALVVSNVVLKWKWENLDFHLDFLGLGLVDSVLDMNLCVKLVANFVVDSALWWVSVAFHQRLCL